MAMGKFALCVRLALSMSMTLPTFAQLQRKVPLWEDIKRPDRDRKREKSLKKRERESSDGNI